LGGIISHFCLDGQGSLGFIQCRSLPRGVTKMDILLRFRYRSAAISSSMSLIRNNDEYSTRRSDNTRFVSRVLDEHVSSGSQIARNIGESVNIVAGEKVNKSADLKCIIIRKRASDHRIVIVRFTHDCCSLLDSLGFGQRRSS